MKNGFREILAFVVVLGFTACNPKSETQPSSPPQASSASPVAHANAAPAVPRGKFHVFYTGLGVFRKNDAAHPTSDYFFEVPAVTETSADAIKDPNDPHKKIPAHEAFLTVDPALILEDLTGGRVARPSKGMFEDLAVIYLSNDELIFQGSGPDHLAPKHEKPENVECPQTESDVRTMYWVPSIKEVGEYSGTTDPATVAVAARVNMTGGYLDSYVFDGSIHFFRDKENGGNHDQAIAQTVDWNFDTTDNKDYVTILRRPANQGGAATPFLRIRKIHPYYKIEGSVTVGGAPVGEILKDQSDVHDPIDQHFEVYYRYAKEQGKIGRRTIPNGMKDCPAGFQIPQRDYIPRWLYPHHKIVLRKRDPQKGSGESNVVILVVGGLNCGPGDWP